MIQMLGTLLSQGEGVTAEEWIVLSFAICRPTRGRLIRSRLVWSLDLCVVLLWMTTTTALKDAREDASLLINERASPTQLFRHIQRS